MIIAKDAEEITTTDAVDPATTMALVNELKSKYNDLATYHNGLLKYLRENREG